MWRKCIFQKYIKLPKIIDYNFASTFLSMTGSTADSDKTGRKKDAQMKLKKKHYKPFQTENV